MALGTLSELFLLTARRGKPEQILHKVDGAYVAVSGGALGERVRRLMRAEDELGIRHGDRVALMAENGLHWPTVDFATLVNGAVLVPVYPTLTGEQAAYVIHDCGAEVVFVQARSRLEALLAVRDRMPAVRRFVLIRERDDAPGDAETPDLEGLLAATEPLSEDEAEERAARCRPEDLATLIYTSGTTGHPKGVMLSHANIASNVVAAAETLETEERHVAISFLPLSHSFERTIDYLYFYRGVTIAYAESIQKVVQNMAEVRPHIFVSVPRVYEKLLARVHESVASSPPLRQRIFRWACEVGERALEYRLRRERPPGRLGVELALADKLVFSKIRDRLGGRFEHATSGGAPLGVDVARFLWGAGIEVYEGYGLTETSPVLTSNAPDAVRLGTVGPAIPGVELRIAEDGEILARGPNIMLGYYNLPEETAEVIDADGWFHTGDIGELDADGFLKITDRKKEILVNAYGKNVAPAPIENALKSSRFIEHAVVIGDRRKFLAALLVPDFEALAGWARAQGLATDDVEALLDEPAVRSLFEGEIERFNGDLARYEQIRAFDLLPAEFTIETGELTPKQSIKRRVVNQRYGDRVERMYREAEAEPH